MDGNGVEILEVKRTINTLQNKKKASSFSA